MKVAHEAPLDIMSTIREYTDYDYILPHLLDEYPEYEKFFRESKEMGRYIIMDNSLAELGYAYDFNRLKYWLHEIKPNEFIVPDVWENTNETLSQAKYWKSYENQYKEELKDVTFVAVVQAKNYEKACLCYQSLKELGYKKIAFSYGAEWYLSFGYDGDLNYKKTWEPGEKEFYRALGRKKTLNNMLEEGYIENNDRVHLLGCAYPGEFKDYVYGREGSKYKFIETIDTSNPVMAGLEGIIYDNGFWFNKPKPNINSHFNKETPFYALQIIKFNIKKFKRLNLI